MWYNLMMFQRLFRFVSYLGDSKNNHLCFTYKWFGVIISRIQKLWERENYLFLTICKIEFSKSIRHKAYVLWFIRIIRINPNPMKLTDLQY